MKIVDKQENLLGDDELEDSFECSKQVRSQCSVFLTTISTKISQTKREILRAGSSDVQF